MKVQNIFKTLLFVVITMTMSLNFSSCSEEDEPGLFVYTATGNLSASGSGTEAFDAFFGIAEYTEAIKSTLGGTSSTTEQDDKVIAACDAVFKNHKTNYPSWKGKVEIKKSKSSISGETSVGEVIKTYNYGN